MANSPRFIEFIRDELAPLGSITVRNMFGGAAVYCDGQVFALITGDVLQNVNFYSGVLGLRLVG